VFKIEFAVRLSLLAGTALLLSCAVGEISDAGGEPRLGSEDPNPSGAPGTPDGGMSSEGGLPVNESGEPISPISGLPLEDPACPAVAPDVSVSNGWRSTRASQPAFDTLDFEVMARPGAADLDGIVAIGGQDIGAFSDAAILVRFASDGLVDARDGSVYDKDATFPTKQGFGTTSRSRRTC
jgi:hypothetical protein